MYLTRQDLKVEVRDLHGQIREVISDFNGAIKNLQEDINYDIGQLSNYRRTRRPLSCRL